MFRIQSVCIDYCCVGRVLGEITSGKMDTIHFTSNSIRPKVMRFL